MSGQKIIDGLREAVAGDFSRVTIEGQTWLRATDAQQATGASNLAALIRSVGPIGFAPAGHVFDRHEMATLLAALDAQREWQEAEPYLVWSNEHRAWWRPNACGYTTKIEAAGRYSRNDAIEHSQTRDHGQDDPPPELPVREADALATIALPAPPASAQGEIKKDYGTSPNSDAESANR